jgi:aminomethyltransferase
MVTNDVEKLLPGQGAYAAHLNAQGKLVAQMTILADSDFIWLSLETSNVHKLSEVLERMIVMEDVQSEDHSSNFESIALLGPEASSVLESWLGEPVGLKTAFDHRKFVKCPRIVREELGYSMWVDVLKVNSILDELRESGATPMDEGTWNIVRTEVGLPIYGVDIDETTTLPELGDKGIRYDKGCYIGQEVVARIKYIGHVNRRFMGFISDAGNIPERGSVVQMGGKDVGYITTSVASPQMEKAISLGFVNRIAAVSGTTVELVSGERRVNSKVSELPFIPSATWSAG